MRTLTILSLCFLTLSLSACSNTWQGLGKDMEKAGENMQKM